MTDLSRDVLAQLDEAASCLLAVGCADPFGTDPRIRLPCLWAVEQLRVVGARPVRVLEALSSDEVVGKLRAALLALTLLPSDLLGQEAVAEAISATCTALDELG